LLVPIKHFWTLHITVSLLVLRSALLPLVLLTMAPEIGSVPNIESKSAKKKGGKIDAAPTSSTGTATPAADVSSQAEPAPNGVDGARDSPYLKELNK
jgi:hypothetical protein